MRSTTFALSASAAALLAICVVDAKHSAHNALEALHRRHRHDRHREVTPANETLGERGLLSCAFPADAGLVPVTPGLLNGGWAFAPDRVCALGTFCPYACPPGQLSMQWDPSSQTYSYPGSRNGGLYCGLDGKVSKPFPDRPYCKSTATNIGVQNKCGGVVSFCQTVLPGDEDMLIPTAVNDFASLAVPDPSYWAGTAAHYYINPPGVSAAQACVWGTPANAFGNWSPFVAGANADSSGQTFIKLGWNPIYLEPTTPFRDQVPDWGVRIECPNGGCNGLPCAIDPTKNKINEMIGSATGGAGGAAFCVVTVPKGGSANFVVFKTGEETQSKAGQFYQPAAGAAASSSSSSSTATTSVQASTTTITSSATTTEASSFIASNTTSSTTQTQTGTRRQLFDDATSSTTTATSSSHNSVSPTASPSQTGAGATHCLSTLLFSMALFMSFL